VPARADTKTVSPSTRDAGSSAKRHFETVVVCVCCACGSASRDAGDAFTTTSVSSGSSGSPDGTAESGSADPTSNMDGSAGTPSSDGTDGEGATSKFDLGVPGPRYDVGGGDDSVGENPGPCGSSHGGDSVDECEHSAPPGSFEPEVQWTWDRVGSTHTPLVANLTDDNGDGLINLCDIPDVVVLDGSDLVVLDGMAGTLHFQITPVMIGTTPALGDIDGDGVSEILVGVGDAFDFRVGAFEHDGTLKWKSAEQWDYLQATASALALADLDNDGDVEIIAGNHVFDHIGNRLWIGSIPLEMVNATTAADLDGDGDLEVIVGQAAYHHDGSTYFHNPEVLGGGAGMFPQVANLDADPEPEVLVAAGGGMYILEHDGTIKLKVAPAGMTTAGGLFPITVHDFDGDGMSEFAVSSGTLYTVHKPAGAIAWSAQVVDASGVAAGTAFDFLGDGVAEAMYADEYTMYAFDGMTGQVVMQVPRSSGTAIEYPTVADVDNDGSAEIIVVSNFNAGPKTAPSVQVIRDKQDRWIATRRIWNQHTYHVTNVNEDGTIPQFEAPNWKTLNTFRTNAQIQGGGVCKPPLPEG